MAILPWLNLGAWVLVLVLSLLIYFDGRGERRWRGKADARLAALEGAVFPAPVTPPTPPPQLPPLARAATQGRPAVPPPPPREGPQSGTRPSQAPREEAPPTPPRTAPDDTRAARTTSNRPPPPVEIVGVTVAVTRASLPGRLVNGPAADPAWVARRVEELAAYARDGGEPFDADAAWRQAQREGRIVGVPPPSQSPPPLDARVERLWHQKITAADEAGENVAHCYSSACFYDTGSVSACECRCKGCVAVIALLHEALREVTGEG